MYEFCMDELSIWFLYIQNLNIYVKIGFIFERCEISLFVINNYIIYLCMYIFICCVKVVMVYYCLLEMVFFFVRNKMFFVYVTLGIEFVKSVFLIYNILYFQYCCSFGRQCLINKDFFLFCMVRDIIFERCQCFGYVFRCG